MMRTSRWFVSVLALVAVIGCGGSQSAKAAYATSPSAQPAASPAGRAEQYANIGGPAAGAAPVAQPAPAEPSPAPMAADDREYLDEESEPVSAGSSRRATRAASTPAPKPKGPATPPGAPGKTTAQAAAATQTQKAPPPDKNLLLIYTANINLAVFEAVKGLDTVETLARDMGGYLVRRTANQIVVRVPAPKFHEALEAIAKVGDELYRDVSVQDVTAQFHDLQIQLGNLLAMRDRLQKLLDRTKNVQEALMVEQQLNRVTGQIEQIKGRLKLMSELTAYSTISVTFQAQPVEQVASTVKLPFPWLDDLGLSNLLQL